VPEIERRNTIHDGVGAAIKCAFGKHSVTSKSLRSEIARCTRSFLSQPDRAYVLATSLTMRQPTHLSHLAFDGVRFSFAEKLPKRFSHAGMNYPPEAKAPHDLPHNYMTVRVRLNGRSGLKR
jgi:hypothetical protein